MVHLKQTIIPCSTEETLLLLLSFREFERHSMSQKGKVITIIIIWNYTSNKGKHGLVFPVCQLLYNISKTLFILNTLNPVCIYINSLEALLQSSNNRGHRMAIKEFLYFLCLLKGSKLRQQKTEEKKRNYYWAFYYYMQHSRIKGCQTC